MAYTIYLRTNKINGMQYVGETENFDRREKEWKCLKRKYANWYITEERNKYGLDNFNVVIINHCETQEEAYELEEKYIKELGTKYPEGYNMTDGGVGLKGYNHLQETKKKISEAHKGKKMSEEHKKKLSEAHKGKNNPFYGKKHSKETREKIIKTRDKKPVVQIDRINGEIIKIWDSARDVEKELDINHSNIAACCKGKYGYKSAYGYMWKYKNEDD